MGVWRENAVDRWSLHLKRSADGGQAGERDMRDNLPATLRDFGPLLGSNDVIATALGDAQNLINDGIAAFPDRRAIVTTLSRAAKLLERAAAGLDAELADRVGHRLTRKVREIDAVILEASATSARAAFDGPGHPGGSVRLDVHVDAPGLAALAIEPIFRDPVDVVEVANEAGRAQYAVEIPATASYTGNYPDHFDPLGGSGAVCVRVSGQLDGRVVAVDLDPETGFVVQPSQSVELEPPVALRRLVGPASAFSVRALGAVPSGWLVPEGWAVSDEGGIWRVEPPTHPRTGVATLVPLIDDRPASSVRIISQPHILQRAFVAPADMNVLTLDVALPVDARIGYVGSGNDNVGSHMRRLGLAVTDLGEAELAGGELSAFTTVVVGIFAFGLRSDLRKATERLHRFVEQGGHLVTLYHRPTDRWDPDRTPPRRLAIGSPSVRWRVTDPSAPVTILSPDSPLLTYPNRIEAADWQGWDKERGLYFVSEHDAAYEELVALNDPGEKPLRGALVSARIGRGRHTHVALVLHHQMDRLVPGAFRIWANLVQPA